MKRLLAIILAGLCSVAHAADVTVQVTGVPEGAAIVLQVYDSANAFGYFRDPVKELRTEASADGEYRLEGVPAGEIAVLIYVDENVNGVLDKNFIGIPKEPLGISNNYRPKGPPAFDKAKIVADESVTTEIDIEIYKVLGERGRLGLGIGAIGRSSPYVASDTTVIKPIPAITYNGERLQWLGPNIQYALAGTDWWRLAASASYRIGVYEEDDSPALAGMGDRDGTLMAGLGMRFEIPGGVNLLLRYEHDVLDKIGGGTATARVSKAFQAGRFRISPQLQINWLNEDIANYDFGVPPESATLERPAYKTGSAVSYEAGIGSFIELTEEWRIILSISAEALPSKISDSPIVDDDVVVKGFAAITYVF